MFSSIIEQEGKAIPELFQRDMAKQRFDAAHAMSWFCRIWSFLTFRSTKVLELKRVEMARRIRNRRYEGLRTVPIDEIRGSENRVNDFDIHFHPIHSRSKNRWMSVATAMLQDRGLPPVELIKLNDTYFVRDGHHRISVAKAFGQKEIDAIVTAWESEPIQVCKKPEKKWSLFFLTENPCLRHSANGCK